jgi:peptide/nickel transport system substrate-binding protein
MSKRLSRRQFLINTGIVAVGGLLVACAADDPAAVSTPGAAPAAGEATAAPAADLPAGKYREAPQLAELVRAGQLPPVDERLPLQPWVIEPLDSVGRYGGKLSSIVADPTANLFEIQPAMVRGIAGRSFDLNNIIPVAVESWELSDDFTELVVHMREGLKWSDGTPLTTEHVMFWYEDIFLNTDLTPVVDQKWAPGGTPMVIVADDDLTFRIQFAVPYPAILDFLPDLIPWSPKQYLSQWHIRYNDQANDLAQSENYETWSEAFLFHAEDTELQQDIDLPTIRPWIFDSQDTQGSRLYVRNPYYWAVDTEGNQLPYVDQMERVVVENREVLTARILAGEGTHHSWFLTLADFPLYKQNEAAGNYTTRLHPDLRASECGFCFNYTHQDEVLRELFNDLRWRQAVSHAINRAEINELRFAGQGVPRNPIMHPGASFWEDGLDQYYTEYNVELANQLLDEIGLEWDANDEFRLRSDGQPMVLTMEVDAGRADLTEICNLIKAYWAEIGVNINVRAQDQQFFMQRMRANEHDIGVWAIGGSSEPYSRQNEPIRYRPPWHWTNTPLGGPQWRQWLDTGGAEGLEPPDVVKELWQITEDWRQQPTGSDEYLELGRRMLQINAENAWCLGTVGLVPRPSIIKNTVRNHPTEEMILSVEYEMWDYYKIEQWWLEA